MNARQKCKKLKQRNKLLMNIVTGNHEFLRVFDVWTRQPFNVTHSRVQFETYVARCQIEPMLGDNARHFAEEQIVRELSHAIKKNIEWRVEDYEPYCIRLEGRIRIEKKDGESNGQAN